MGLTEKASGFIQANYDYYKDKLFGNTPDHIREQIEYRLAVCANDCVVTGKCKVCSCPTKKKSWQIKSCNPVRFPDMMDKDSWEKYKNETGI